MTTITEDFESAHPRATNGKFTEKDRTAAEVGLSAPSLLVENVMNTAWGDPDAFAEDLRNGEVGARELSETTANVAFGLVGGTLPPRRHFDALGELAGNSTYEEVESYATVATHRARALSLYPDLDPGQDPLRSALVEVNSRVGKREVTSATAGVLAEFLLRRTDVAHKDLPHLSALAAHPDTRLDDSAVVAAHRELGGLYEREHSSRAKLAIDMLYTYTLMGADED